MPTLRSSCAVLAAAALLLTGCARDITGTAITAAGTAPDAPADGESQCATVPASMADIPAKNSREPALRIPVPAGWERNSMMDNQVIRFAIVAQDLIENQFAPNAVVTLESVRGAPDPDAVLARNRTNLSAMMGASDLHTESNTTCGLRSETTTYTAPPMGPAPQRPVIMHAVVAQSGPSTYLATLTVQTTDDQNPTYARDSEQIVRGFQMLMP